MLSASYIQSALSAWGKGQVIEPIAGGYRNAVYLVELENEHYVAKSTRRSEAGVRWLEQVFQLAQQAGITTPKLMPSLEGPRVVNAVTLETFIEGQPPRPEGLEPLKTSLRRFHTLSRTLPQRPGFCSSLQLLTQTSGGVVDLAAMPAALVALCRDIWRGYRPLPQSVIHGDINLGNCLMTPEGRIALVDWDEARVDLSLFDSLQLAKMMSSDLDDASFNLLDSWEVAVSWGLEPEYARQIAARLQARLA